MAGVICLSDLVIYEYAEAGDTGVPFSGESARHCPCPSSASGPEVALEAEGEVEMVPEPCEPSAEDIWMSGIRRPIRSTYGCAPPLCGAALLFGRTERE